MAAEAVAVVLDIGPFMEHSLPGENSQLQTAVECLKLLIQRKLFAEKKDEYCFIICGSETTVNDLEDDDGNFQNISLVRPLQRINWDILEYLNQDFNTTQITADVIDAVIVAVDHLMHQTKGKKGIGSKRVVLISNLGGEINGDQISRITKNLKKADVELCLIGYELDSGDEGQGENGTANTDTRQLGGAPSNPDRPHIKTKTPTQLKNAEIMSEILTALSGDSYTFDEILPALGNFETRGILQRAWKADLEIGGDLQIPVNGYTKLKEAKPKSMMTVNARDPESPITVQRSYHKGDEAETEVDLEDTVKGFRYGSTLVPFSDEDMENMKLQVEKSLKVVGFAKAKDVPRHLYMGDSVLVFVADGEGAGPALSALVQALTDTDRVALVRRVYSRATAPRLGVLTPATRAGCHCLEYSELVFAEDLGTFTLASLPVGPKGGEEQAQVAKYRPSEPQLDAVDSLIDSMMLHSDAQKSHNSEGNEDSQGHELLQPSRQINPYIQHLYQSAHYRAFHDRDPLPGPSTALLQSLEPPRQLSARASPVIDRLAYLFKLTRREKEKKKMTAGEMFKEEDSDTSAKRARLDEDAPGNSDLSGGLGSLVRGNVTEVGSVDPVADFEVMVSRGLFAEASSQMIARIMQLVTDSYQDFFYSKALACLLALRVAAMKLDKPDVFNTFLRRWRLDLDKPTSTRQDFWAKLVSESLGLVTSEEASSSGVSPSEATTFLSATSATELTSVDLPTTGLKEDVDDLLDEMD